MGEYMTGHHRKVFRSDDPDIQIELLKIARLHDGAHRDGDDERAKLHLIDAIELKMGVKVEDGEGERGLLKEGRPELHLIKGGLYQSPRKLGPTA